MIYAEQYIEVIKNWNDKWNVELVVEPLKGAAIREILHENIDTMEEGDEIGQSYCDEYNKTIYFSDINWKSSWQSKHPVL